MTAGGRTYPLERPFFVLATQNPIEQEGTYRYPRPQLDRFMFSVKPRLSGFEEEVRIVGATTSAGSASAAPVVSNAGRFIAFRSSCAGRRRRRASSSTRFVSRRRAAPAIPRRRSS